MTEPSVSFADNLTDQPEVRYTDGGIARTAAPARPSRSWPRSWGRASLVHLGGGTCLECRRTPVPSGHRLRAWPE